MRDLGGFSFAFILWGGGEKLDEGVGVDPALVVDLHRVEGVVDLLGGELVAPGHESVSEPFAVDGAVLVERPESSDDDFVVIGAAGVLHAVAEQAQQLGEVDRSRGLVDHLVELLLVGEFAHGVEGRPKIGLADDAVLVVVHQLEAFLELSYLRLGEHGEDIGTRALGLLRRALGRGSGFGGWSRGGCSFRWRFFLLLLLNLLFFVRHCVVSVYSNERPRLGDGDGDAHLNKFGSDARRT
jgi:hypothetical protein